MKRSVMPTNSRRFISLKLFSRSLSLSFLLALAASAVVSSTAHARRIRIVDGAMIITAGPNSQRGTANTVCFRRPENSSSGCDNFDGTELMDATEIDNLLSQGRQTISEARVNITTRITTLETKLTNDLAANIDRIKRELKQEILNELRSSH